MCARVCVVCQVRVVSQVYVCTCVVCQVLHDAAVQSASADLLWEALKATITPSILRWGATGKAPPHC